MCTIIKSNKPIRMFCILTEKKYVIYMHHGQSLRNYSNKIELNSQGMFLLCIYIQQTFWIRDADGDLCHGDACIQMRDLPVDN